MIQADPDAGAYYVCNPNNPTGTLTPRKDIEYLLANKKKDAVVVVDEAYIHFSDDAQTCRRIWWRRIKTLSCCGLSRKFTAWPACAPDSPSAGRICWPRLRPFAASGFLPITGSACATASLKVKDLVAERRASTKAVRENTFEFLEKKGISFIPSQTNFFMMEVKQPGDGIRQGDGRGESDYRAHLAGVAHQGPGNGGVAG